MTQPTDVPSDAMKQLITLRLGAAGFVQHWKHCDLVANYLAAFTSELLEQSESQANLVSTVLNELLEVVFRRNASSGQITIILAGDDSELIVQIWVPVQEADRLFYQEVAEMVARQDVHDLHRQQLAQPPSDEQHLTLGLLELSAVYGAVLEVTLAEEDGSSVLLRLPFRLKP